jgi:hypothetical protein
MKVIIKNWKTSLIGVVIIVGLAYTGLTDGFTVSEAIAGLIAIGFLKAKDKKV